MNRSFSKERMLMHLVFSTALMLGLYTAIHYYWGLISHSFLITVLSLLFFLACVYTGRWVCQRWYLKHQPIPFIIYSIISLACIVFLWPLFTQYIFHARGELIENAVTTVPFYITAFAMGFFIKATRDSIKRKVDEAHAAAEQKQTQLDVLQSQLSPHFLFNTLNNLYGISITQHEKVPSLLLKLSDLLRYSVYNNRQLFVPLQEEIGYINNYIDFERLRMGEKLVLHKEMDASIDASIKVPPMLFIVFVENGFKHSKNTLDKRIFITICLKQTDERLYFTIENSVDRTEIVKKKKEPGIGLANVKKRLQLLYSNDYVLELNEDELIFRVNLQIPIKHQ
jgi:sensor histidine kinase YesM